MFSPLADVKERFPGNGVKLNQSDPCQLAQCFLNIFRLDFPQGEKAQAAAIAAAKQYGAVLVGKVQGFDLPIAPAFSTLESQGVLKEDLLQELAVAETLA